MGVARTVVPVPVPLAAFKDLCLDADDPARLAVFWSAVLDRSHELLDDGDAVLEGATPGHTVWLNRVPEPRTVKGRVHLDIYCRSLDDLSALGAAVVDRDCGQGRWTVMADPEGNEFCAFVRAELAAERLHGLVVDSADPVTQAAWWAQVYGAEIEHHSDQWATVRRVPGMPVETMDFVAVPEPKTVKNRVHWDVTTSDVDHLVASGATMLAPAGELRWNVLADREGNEFCAFVVSGG